MTFMDQQWAYNELVSKSSARQLQLWLGTIAPVQPEISIPLNQLLLQVAKELGWETEKDEQIGEIIK